jgi:hypothetical protein
MNSIPTISLSSPYSPLSVSPTNDLRLGVGRHRRYAYAHSTNAEESPRS